MTFKTLILIPIFSTICCFCHQYLFDVFEIETANFKYSLWQLYLFFGISTTIIMAISIKMKHKNLDQVGMVFMAATVFKMMLSIAVVRPILNQVSENFKIQKLNFFVLFVLFLAIETVLTIRILNNKQ